MNGRAALVLLLVVLAAFFGPPLLRGEVIYPHDNSLELGASALDSRAPDERPWTSILALDRPPISNRKFFDESSIYVPEIHHHLHGRRAGWLSTWNPHVEFGRPSLQMYGFGPASPITRVLSLFTSDAFQLYTWIVASTLILAALFAFLFLRALELDPWAAFAGAVGIGLGYVVLYWQTALMLPSGVCWTLAELWLVARFVQRPTFARGLGIAFATYMLLVTAYPQQIVWHVYLLGAFVLWSLVRERRAGRSPWKPAVALLACGAAGIAATLPLYLDIVLQARESARLDVDPEFFLTLPDIRSPLDLGLFLAKLHDAFWLGNPIFRGYPGKFNWLSLTPVFSTLLCWSWIDGGWRRAWLWQAFVLVCLAMTLWPAAMVFGVRFLGLSLSPYVPMAAAVIPCGVAAAMSVDAILRGGSSRPWIATAIAVALPAFAALCHAQSNVPLYPGYVGASVVLSLLAIAFAWRRNRAWIVALVLLSTALYAARLVLWRPRDSIHATSPLVRAIEERTRDGSRYAFVGGREIELLPPNHEVRLGLASVHSYNPLTTRFFQSFVLRLSELGPRTYGRQFRRITSDAKLAHDEFSYCNIGAYVSAEELASPAVALGDEIAIAPDGAIALAPDGAIAVVPGDAVAVAPNREMDVVRVYAPVVHPPLPAAQIDGVGDARDADGGVSLTGTLGAQVTLPIERLEAHDDAVQYRLTRCERPTLLFVSQQFHPQWKARSPDGDLRTLRVNAFFQGVLVPPGTERVELRFEPFVRWSYVPHWIFALGGAVALFRSLNRRARARTVR